jgi:hypothetical protein
VVRLDAHDSCRRDLQVTVAEVADPNEIGGDERILQRDEDVERRLRVGEHLRRVVELRERGRLFCEAFLEQIVRHLLLPRCRQISLVVCGDVLEERSRADDVGVGRDGERLGDLRGFEDFQVALAQRALLGRAGRLLAAGKRRRGPEGSETGRSGTDGRRALEEAVSRQGCRAWVCARLLL